MKIKTNATIVIVEEKDLSPSAIPTKGTSIDVLIVPKSLEELWQKSELKMAIIPALKTNGLLLIL